MQGDLVIAVTDHVEFVVDDDWWTKEKYTCQRGFLITGFSTDFPAILAFGRNVERD